MNPRFAGSGHQPEGPWDTESPFWLRALGTLMALAAWGYFAFTTLQDRIAGAAFWTYFGLFVGVIGLGFVLSRTLHGYLVFLAGWVAYLVFAGGLVTTMEAQLSVPDWPLAYGQVNVPLMGLILFEHTHRMIAFVAALLTLIAWVWVFSRRRDIWHPLWILMTLEVILFGALVPVLAVAQKTDSFSSAIIIGSATALCALIMGAYLILKNAGSLVFLTFFAGLAVQGQAILGGVTVDLLTPTTISVGHAVLGQIYFCLLVAMALTSSRRYKTVAGIEPHAMRAINVAYIGVALLFAQLFLGALVRHMDAAFAITSFPLAGAGWVLPKDPTPGEFVHMAHRIGAVVVTLFLVFMVGRVERTAGRCREAAILARAAMLLLIIQVSLGISVVLMGPRDTANADMGSKELVASGHVVVGALLMAAVFVCGLFVRRAAVRPERSSL